MKLVFAAGYLLGFYYRHRILALLITNTYRKNSMLYFVNTLFNKKITIVIITFLTLVGTAQATIVEFQTSHGNFKVNLHDKTTPLTVANFLKYTNSERYNNSIIHRSMNNFIVQGGGFNFAEQLPLNGLELDVPVKNEPIYSNVRGTIAMAKQGNKPNSATSQWFINLKDNNKGANGLDLQNSGFTVFGEVIEDGMQTLEAIATLPLCHGVGAGNLTIDNVPVNNNSTNNCTTPGAENFVTVYSVTVIDDSTSTDSSLNSVKNTLITKTPDTDKKSDGGGSLIWLLLLTPCLFRYKNSQ